jgi:glycerophosphoryl diester phosphodiesterase
MPRLDDLPAPRRHAADHWRPRDRPQVVAHRGASSVRAEHTLAAYQQALQDGAEAVECDVRLTADGHLVCVHDRRIDRTSTGKGVVSTFDLHELQQLDWQSWKHPWQDLDDEADGETQRPGAVLTLQRLLDTVRDWGRPVEVAIETKHPTRYAGLVERRLVELLHRYGWAKAGAKDRAPVRVMSFSWLSLRRCLDLAPAVEMVYLMDRVPLLYRDGTLPSGATSAGPSIEIIRAHPRYVERAHAAGHAVHVWTVNSKADLDLCATLGVDAVMTDEPAKALKRLAAGGAEGVRGEASSKQTGQC